MSASIINLSSSTPAAGAGMGLGNFQADSATPRNVSVEFPSTGGVNPQSGSTYTIVLSDRGKLVSLAYAGNVAVTITAGGTLGAGFYCGVQNQGSGTATLTPASGTINGGGSLALATGTGSLLYCDGSNFEALIGGGGGSFTAGGDLSGTSSSQEVIGIQNKLIDGGPTDGDVLKYSSGSGKWEPTALAGLYITQSSHG